MSIQAAVWTEHTVNAREDLPRLRPRQGQAIVGLVGSGEQRLWDGWHRPGEVPESYPASLGALT